MRRMHCDTSIWHVFNRGARRLLLFQDDRDYATFLQCLVFGLQQSACELWGYALMSNHYHLVLYGDSDQLTECLYHVNKLYAHLHNARYKLGGHVFDGPYQAYRVPTSRLALWTLAYVFLNPVKAGLCDEPQDYRWSGYRSFVGVDGSPLPVDSAAFMRRVDLPLEQAWQRFHDVLRIEKLQPTRTLAGRPTMAEVHFSQFAWLQRHARDHAALLQGEDPMKVAVWWGRQCGITPRIMAKALDLDDSQEIRYILQEFKKRLVRDPSLARLSTIP
jgi:putative transposase